MESYGAILKKTREDKKLAFETIERETTITRQYIVALEEEDSSVFPGEPYLVGFLKNYADYLGVDSDEVIKLYHAKKIQESPVPEGLIQKQKPAFLLPLIIISSVIIAGIVAFTIYFFMIKLPTIKTEHERILELATKNHQYIIDEKGLTKRLYKGDQLLVPARNADSNIILTVNGTLGTFSIDTPVGKQIFDLSEERELDIDGDGKEELIIYLSDISSTDESRGAEIRVIKKDGVVDELSTVSDADIETVNTTDVVDSQNNIKQTLILEDSRAYPFTINVSFRGACIFRYRVDRKENVEDYYESGDIVNVTASNAVRLWMSKNNALKIQIIAGVKTYDLEVGKAGQVQAEDIKWIKEGDGRYRLVVTELD